jgi:hypothetical protein
MTIIGPDGQPLVSSSQTLLTTSELVAKIESPNLPKAAKRNVYTD